MLTYKLRKTNKDMPAQPLIQAEKSGIIAKIQKAVHDSFELFFLCYLIMYDHLYKGTVLLVCLISQLIEVIDRV